MEVHIIYIACNSLKLLRQGLRGDLDVAGCQLHPWNMEGAELQLFTSITMFACNLHPYKFDANATSKETWLLN
ncbi:hypothetical protein FRX31_013865 [Thalictrum thalictroides]|uniref:Uncharacterized protein n=1 Tax=Thalictrum thalictroides TaxID=46969 RepID=A0A7J6WI17_THATH|nr:hypothetical protein FRX31_013865 [Thalictrum thalictroides]